MRVVKPSWSVFKREWAGKISRENVENLSGRFAAKGSKELDL